MLLPIRIKRFLPLFLLILPFLLSSISLGAGGKRRVSNFFIGRAADFRPEPGKDFAEQGSFFALADGRLVQRGGTIINQSRFRVIDESYSGIALERNFTTATFISGDHLAARQNIELTSIRFPLEGNPNIIEVDYQYYSPRNPHRSPQSRKVGYAINGKFRRTLKLEDSLHWQKKGAKGEKTHFEMEYQLQLVKNREGIENFEFGFTPGDGTPQVVVTLDGPQIFGGLRNVIEFQVGEVYHDRQTGLFTFEIDILRTNGLEENYSIPIGSETMARELARDGRRHEFRLEPPTPVRDGFPDLSISISDYGIEPGGFGLGDGRAGATN